jgi:hypothetical protein
MRAMKIAGIEVRQPTGQALTVSVTLGVVVWLTIYAFNRVLLGHEPSAFTGGAWFVVIVWGMVSNDFGIQLQKGTRHITALLITTAVWIGVYAGLVGLVG